MKKCWKSLFLVLFFCAGLVASAVLPAHGEAAMRVAWFPVAAAGTWTPVPRDTVGILEKKMDQALHVPLNGVLQAVEFVPEAEEEQALQEVMAALKAQKKHVRLRDAMQPLAEKLHADLVICPVVANYEEFETFGGLGLFGDDIGEEILHSYVTMELTGYDRLTGKVIYASRSDSWRDTYSPSGQADVLIQGCMDAVLEETDLHGRVTNWRAYAKQEQATPEKQ